MVVQPSDRLLTLCARPSPGPAGAAEIRALLPQIRDWEGLLRRADEEGVLALLYRNSAGFPEAVPPPVLDRLKNRYFSSLARNERIYRNLEPFLAAVRRRNLRAALTKGARLAVSVYPDIALRPFWDIDVIVHPADWPELRTVLAELGFAEAGVPEDVAGLPETALDWTYSPYFKGHGLVLEFHFNSLGLHLPFISQDDFWAAVRTMSVRAAEAPVLSAEYELCYLCLHAQQHSYQNLIWLSDIAELASRPDIDWDRVAAISSAEKVRGPVFHAFALVNSVWPGTVSPDRLDRIRPSALERSALRFFWPERAIAVRRGAPAWPYYMPSLFSLWERKNLPLAFRTLQAIFFPPRPWLARASGLSDRSPRLLLRYARRIARPFHLALRRLLRKA